MLESRERVSERERDTRDILATANDGFLERAACQSLPDRAELFRAMNSRIDAD